MTLSKLLRLLVPATLVFAFAAPAWADAPTHRIVRLQPAAMKAIRAMQVKAKTKAPPAMKQPGKPIKNRPALPRR